MEVLDLACGEGYGSLLLAYSVRPVTDGENIIIAYTPADFANVVAKVHQDENLRDKISQRGLDFTDKMGAESA